MDHSPLRRDALRWPGRLGVLIVAGAALLGACSSGGGSGPAEAASSHRFAAYRQCLEQHGVTPRTQGSESSTTDPASAAAYTAARKACASLRPAGGLRGGGINSGPRKAFRRCMTDHGVTLPTAATRGTGPDPSSTEAAPRGGMLNGLDRKDPVVVKALDACRSLLVSPSTSSSTKPK
ncbi:MAG: hypothetical protein QOD57_591 [Actinomycetota bacterium]|jgi:hypothetical protein|nr:hypothetical protein [Actinomycetota bacterium]